MRTHGFRTHILLVVAGAVAVLAGLGRPWYDRAPTPQVGDIAIGEVNGPLSGFFEALKRWITDPEGRTGAHALGTVGQVITALAVLCAVAAVVSMVPGVQRVVAAPLRYAGVALIGLVAWRVIDPPGSNADWELRHGALISLCGALVVAICAQTVASAPSRKRVVTPAYVPPPPPPAYEGSTAPPTY
jgi:drug/metabolite transporter superfamily protein YnfA